MRGFLIYSDNRMGPNLHICGDIWPKGKLQSAFVAELDSEGISGVKVSALLS